jgi:hypothetical protein
MLMIHINLSTIESWKSTSHRITYYTFDNRCWKDNFDGTAIDTDTLNRIIAYHRNVDSLSSFVKNNSDK